MVEHLPCKQGVRSSNLLTSIYNAEKIKQKAELMKIKGSKRAEKKMCCIGKGGRRTPKKESQAQRIDNQID